MTSGATGSLTADMMTAARSDWSSAGKMISHWFVLSSVSHVAFVCQVIEGTEGTTAHFMHSFSSYHTL